MRNLETFFIGYIAAWSLASVIAAALVWRRPADFAIAGTRYRDYLTRRWKLATFTVAAIGITVIAPYTGDPTWEYYDAFIMSVLTFATAPWSIGTLYLFLRRKTGAVSAYVALCAMLFSASWCYDIYLVVRDGMYPVTWWTNLAASSILYILAGMLWNLEWRAGRGAIFGFMEPGWPDPAHADVPAKLAWYAIPIMLLVCALILPFLWGGWG